MKRWIWTNQIKSHKSRSQDQKVTTAPSNTLPNTVTNPTIVGAVTACKPAAVLLLVLGKIAAVATV